MSKLDSWDDVPEFGSEAEEAEFWTTHELGPNLLDQMKPVRFVRRPARAHLGIRDERLLHRLESEARRRGLTVDELAEQLLSEGLHR